jgi:hypothetical protein
VIRQRKESREEEVEEMQQVSHGGEEQETQKGQDLSHLWQGEQPLPGSAEEVRSGTFYGNQKGGPPTQKFISPSTKIRYSILSREQLLKPAHHDNVNRDPEEGSILQDQPRLGTQLLEQTADHDPHTAGKSIHENKQEKCSNLQLSKTDQNYSTYQTVPQELPPHQGVNTHMQTRYGQSFPLEEPNKLAPQAEQHDQQYNPFAQIILNYVHQDPPLLNYPFLLDMAPNVSVLCPMGMLPSGACPWRGKNRYRQLHIVKNHTNYLVPSNFIKMPFNCVAIMNAYTEYFICYTVTCSVPGKLYCIVQHACTSCDCMLSYQYRCEIYAENRYEKICITRLVGHFKDDFNTLTQTGNCVSLDTAVVNSFTSNDEFYIHVTVLIPEPV